MKYFISFFFLTFLVNVGMTQNPERITESSIMGLDQFLDDIVPNTLTIENRVLPYNRIIQQILFFILLINSNIYVYG